MRASDSNYYITKFQGNPQHMRIGRGKSLLARSQNELRFPFVISGWLS
jgi:hypothetical protein